MPSQTNREACPGYLYASAIAQSLIRDFKKVPLADKEARGEKLLAALDYGRTLLQVAEPLVKGTPHQGAFEELYQQLQNLARPWSDEAREHFIEDSRTGLVVEVVYELQRDIRELKRAVSKKKKAAPVVMDEGRAA